ncbi:MAG: hypothetical protein M5U34_20650 [Chloroflexi bacterium]|nr:hypothetical protein [Chloroflexota bacterium]
MTPMTIQGHATPSGTQAVAQNHPHLPYAPLADTGLLVSRVGFRASSLTAAPENQAVRLTQALAQGVNLVDTSKIEGEIEIEIEQEREGGCVVGESGLCAGGGV